MELHEFDFIFTSENCKHIVLATYIETNKAYTYLYTYYMQLEYILHMLDVK